MEKLLGTLVLVAICNTALVELVKWVLSKVNLEVKGTLAYIISWACPFIAAFLATAMGLLEATVLGTLLWGGLVAATSNKVFDVYAWFKGRLALWD